MTGPTTLRSRWREESRVGTSMATSAVAIAVALVLSACGGDGREMALPAAAPTAADIATDQTTELPELSVVVVEPLTQEDAADPDDAGEPQTTEPAETTALPVATNQPVSTMSDQARRELPDLCEPFVSVMALEDSRPLMAIQGDDAKDAAELKRQRDLDALRDAILSTSIVLDDEVAFAVQTLRIFPINDGVIADANYLRALQVTRSSLTTACGVG